MMLTAQSLTISCESVALLDKQYVRFIHRKWGSLMPIGFQCSAAYYAPTLIRHSIVFVHVVQLCPLA
jgi:hypothetical protein